MIVVAIIGILATIAIPNFLRYQAKAKQTEAKSNLVALHTSEIAYFAENNGFIDDFNALGFGVSGASQRYYYELGGVSGASQRYYYELGNANLGTLPPGCTASSLDGVSATGFTAVAIGNIDGDATCDVWTIDDQKVLKNVTNDVSS
jgi:type IV pilus assembly protein PilA